MNYLKVVSHDSNSLEYYPEKVGDQGHTFQREESAAAGALPHTAPHGDRDGDRRSVLLHLTRTCFCGSSQVLGLLPANHLIINPLVFRDFNYLKPWANCIMGTWDPRRI